MHIIFEVRIFSTIGFRQSEILIILPIFRLSTDTAKIGPIPIIGQMIIFKIFKKIVKNVLKV
jgi:hypothetical protein